MALTEDQWLIILHIKGRMTLPYAIYLPNNMSTFHIDCCILLLFFHFSYFHQLISFLIHRLRNTCDFIMKIEHYIGKVDLLTVFSIPLIYLKNKVWMFFKNFNDLFCSRSEKRKLVRNLFINSPRRITSEEVWQLLLSSSWKLFQHLISTVASWKLVNGTLKSIYFVLFWYSIHSTCLHISFPSSNW